MAYLSVKNVIRVVGVIIGMVLALCSCRDAGKQMSSDTPKISEVNAAEITAGNRLIAITGVTIIDGNGGQPLSDGCVLVNGNMIEAVGSLHSVAIPEEAEVVDASGMTLMPGLIDAHFHLDRTKGLPSLFLRNGVTSVRDPGAWIEAYKEEREGDRPNPRLFLCGPHLDMPPPAYPYDAYIVRDSIETVNAVNKQISEGASAIKVYFRMPPDLIRIACNTAREKGVPVTAHLEITEAMEAIEAGLDGVEHITSFGLTLTPRRQAEKYRQSVLSSNDFRRHGRYELWSALDIDGKEVDSLARFLVRKGTFISPTLGPFEYRFKDGDHDTTRLKGFNNMKALTARLQKAGVRMVLGSHSMIEYAEEGWAYQREMELLVESGIDPADVIIASTIQNARYFRIEDRLGSIEKGKIADLILLKGDPLKDISAMRNIERVMLNGVWIR
ncbi:MAG: amidohydrolase family protein [Chitinophagaceae bacterium]|nr:amidohydrolase family protein [Chitinophagaceae bacterium]MCW5925699.1 amidohydrolase family protein [Chitinophagaceae bacterium]